MSIKIDNIYEDDNWVVDKIKYDCNDSAYLRISYFEDYHFVEELIIPISLINSEKQFQ